MGDLNPRIHKKIEKSLTDKGVFLPVRTLIIIILILIGLAFLAYVALTTKTKGENVIESLMKQLSNII